MNGQTKESKREEGQRDIERVKTRSYEREGKKEMLHTLTFVLFVLLRCQLLHSLAPACALKKPKLLGHTPNQTHKS